MAATNVKFETVSLWVQIWGAPLDMDSSKVVAEVGRRLGVVEEVETRQKQENRFIRVKVAIPISKPIRRGGFIAGSEGECTWVTYKYERHPIFCHFCGLGHDVRHCVGYFAASKKGEEVLYQYGDWLKSMGTRSWSPPRRGKSHRTTGEVGVMEKQGEHGKQRTETVDVGAMANPPTQETSINDKGKKLATAPDIQEVNAEDNRVDVEVTECEATDCEVIDLGISSFNAVEDVLPINAMHLTTNLQVGPNKQNPKWTRFQGMESEPVG
uniref:Zinc knuckle CX2CX4HX4C domain-containing protein n=1 Tax=Quercus lobata TaxID=97700 RepID=A0A7N2LI06_QUELO